MARGSNRRRKQSVADKRARPQDSTPKSMVVCMGSETGGAITQLSRDMRHVLEPDTAVRLKERRANKLRDYTTMCGPLGVTHLVLFSRSSAGNASMRVCRTPRGPTLHFRVDQYSLMKDLMKSQKHARAGATSDYQVAPLLVMNNFVTSDADRERLGDAAPPKHLEKLVTDMFQGIFPPIQPHTTPLHTIKRVLLLNREEPGKDGTLRISLRHYAITTKVIGLPKALRRLHAAEKLKKTKKSLLNLGGLEDVADLMLDPSGAGYTSASETEVETDAEVEVSTTATRKVLSRREREKLQAGDDGRKIMARGARGGSKIEKRAVRLIEIGPRMSLRLTKVEEDICGGKVLWHEFVTKSKVELEKMEEVWDQRNKEKEERRRIQKENIEKKRKERAERGEDAEDEENEEMEDYDDYDLDDDVWHDEANGGEDGGEEDDDMEDEA